MNPLLTLFQTGRSLLSTLMLEVSHGPNVHGKRCPICERGTITEGRTYDHGNIKIWGYSTPQFPAWLQGTGLIVDAALLETLIMNGVSGFISHPVKDIDLQTHQLQHLPQPAYFILEITGRVDLDRKYYDQHRYNLCPGCKRLTEPDGSLAFSFAIKGSEVPLLESWDGRDFCLQGNIPNARTIWISRKVVDICLACKWPGFVPPVSGFPPPDLTNPNWDYAMAQKVAEKFPELPTYVRPEPTEVVIPPPPADVKFNPSMKDQLTAQFRDNPELNAEQAEIILGEDIQDYKGFEALVTPNINHPVFGPLRAMYQGWQSILMEEAKIEYGGLERTVYWKFQIIGKANHTQIKKNGLLLRAAMPGIAMRFLDLLGPRLASVGSTDEEAAEEVKNITSLTFEMTVTDRNLAPLIPTMAPKWITKGACGMECYFKGLHLVDLCPDYMDPVEYGLDKWI